MIGLLIKLFKSSRSKLCAARPVSVVSRPSAATVGGNKKWVCRSCWPPHAWPHSVRTGYPHTPTQGNTTTLKRRQGAQHGLYGRIYILSSLWQDSHFRMFLPFAFTYLLAVAQMMYHAIVGARRNVTRLGPWLCLCLLLQGSSSSFRGVMVFRASSSQWLRLRRQRGGVARPPRRR